MNEINYLNKVCGYSQIKEELKLIKDWYKSNKNLNTLPKGILFYGEMGTGKTFLMKEYAESFNVKIFELVGDNSNLENEIHNLYKKAKDYELAIVIIDELDKLINDDYRVSRALQMQLDGFNKTNNIITLATSNSLDDIPEPLLRTGRFDRIIHMGEFEESDIKDLILNFINLNKHTIKNDDLNELIDTFRYKTPSLIKACIDDACNRSDSLITSKMVLRSLDLISRGSLKDPNLLKLNKEIAIHEAGHALYLYKYSKSQKFLRVRFNELGGLTVSKSNEEYESLNSRIENIRCSLSGIIAEELILKYHDIGCTNDLDNAYDLAYRLVNRTSIKGINNYLDKTDYIHKENISEIKKRILESKANKYLKEQYKKVLKMLKKDKELIMELANFMLTYKELNRRELIQIVND